MTHKMGAKGQVVVPKEFRERAGLHPGAEVEFFWHNDQIVLAAAKGRQSLAGRFSGAPGMAARLLEDRASEPR